MEQQSREYHTHTPTAALPLFWRSVTPRVAVSTH